MSLERDYKRASERGKYNAKSKCAVCGEKIVGKAWRIGENRFACNRCNNEVPGE